MLYEQAWPTVKFQLNISCCLQMSEAIDDAEVVLFGISLAYKESASEPACSGMPFARTD